MKQLVKNQMLLYIIVPVLAALWPIWVSTISIPSASADWTLNRKEYLESQKLFSQILELDPDRLSLADAGNKVRQFSYASAVQQAAGSCNISPANYKLSSGVPMKIGEQEVQTADVTLKELDILTFAKFLDTIQLRWPNLQCTQLKLTKIKGEINTWKCSLKFKYYK
jgi:hypothetical protein